MSKTIHNNKYQALVQELTQERVRLNISQGELAEQVGLNQSDISKIEKFERRLDVLEFSQILSALRIKENLRLQAIVREFTGGQHD
ncbi:helix-turn-helix transcriptional regulator [Marinomonas sp. GJ51-6]|uniref:helix-turn-helix domain-containing protein n=1 Tax=Marinomonas sp. GJ51-6 TaxID=2992802 RepID=UPI002934559C|nr:helix-turn-helix transcriptional regulator [Marinomonas sp. GJ51-6]WOD08283.1 helix-turn-helix transcriptional regulator [Marinomonas sp. GJ51-6]